jgi:hypothetical protein
MEEKIRELIADFNMPCHYGVPSSDVSLAAKEITAHVFEFIEWLSYGRHPFVPWYDEKGHYYTDELSDHRYSIEELYDHYINLEK